MACTCQPLSAYHTPRLTFVLVDPLAPVTLDELGDGSVRGLRETRPVTLLLLVQDQKDATRCGRDLAGLDVDLPEEGDIDGVVVAFCRAAEGELASGLDLGLCVLDIP